MLDWIAEMARLHAARTPFALLTVVAVQGSGPGRVGQRALLAAGRLLGTVGGGRVEAAALDEAKRALDEATPRKVTLKLVAELGMCCGGTMEIFVEPILPAETVHLFGAGHVSRPTAQILVMCGFHVIVYDEREEWNSAERFPGCERVPPCRQRQKGLVPATDLPQAFDG